MVELDELAIAFIKSRNEAYIKHCAAPVGAFRADVYHDTREGACISCGSHRNLSTTFLVKAPPSRSPTQRAEEKQLVVRLSNKCFLCYQEIDSSWAWHKDKSLCRRALCDAKRLPNSRVCEVHANPCEFYDSDLIRLQELTLSSCSIKKGREYETGHPVEAIQEGNGLKNSNSN
jgi:hypothetical protein